ncbi:MAG TPA: thiamine pyrophosphate-dependent enzyme [Polyangiaceae bacterium]|nr:thiamine pyrophosphate-dependent enzyme [Polyangiaceae bacterium]
MSEARQFQSTSSEPTDIERTVRWLEEAERPVCLVGRGAIRSGATADLLELCARIPRLRVASTAGAKGVFPEQHAQAVGVWGFAGHAAARQAVIASDALLILGSRLLEQSSGDWHPRLLGPRVVRVDLDTTRLVAHHEQSIGLSGDIHRILGSINRSLADGTPKLVLTASTSGSQSAIPSFTGAPDEDCLVKPQGLFSVLNRVAIEVPLCADAGNAMCWAIERLVRQRARDFQVSLDWGTMGFALPAAIGISLARGKEPVIALTGDGSMAMAGGDLHTAVELELPLIVIVLNDGGAGMVRQGSRAWFGPDAIPNPDYRYKLNFVAYARGFGAHGEVVTSCAAFESQLERALTRGTPTLFDVQVDPSEVPAAIQQRIQGLTAETDESPVRNGGGMC